MNQSSITPDYIFVGSDNPVKVNAVIESVQNWSSCQVIGLPVSSRVPKQPMSDEQTLLGAQNRAVTVLAQGEKNIQVKSEQVCLGVGLEGGVYLSGDQLWSTVWAVVVDQDQQQYCASGARIKLPELIAKPILAGQEMGDVLSDLFAGRDIKRTCGMIGIITNHLVTRTHEYANLVKLALGLWYGRDWQFKVGV